MDLVSSWNFENLTKMIDKPLLLFGKKPVSAPNTAVSHNGALKSLSVN
jgi:hypothetical protein